MQNLFTQDNIMLLARVLAFLIAMPVHEWAHAFVSDKLGDRTARELGRLTLNPFKHIDPWGFLSMLLIGVGWAKPVPVNPSAYKNRKAGMAVTAAAGPLSNLLLAFFTMIIYKVYYYGCLLALGPAARGPLPLWMNVSSMVLYYFIYINISLALFNLLPIPPLDGSRVVGLLVPNRFYYAIQRYERYFMIGLMAVLFLLPRLTGFNLVGALLGGVASSIMDGLVTLTGFIDILFGRMLA